MGYADRFYYGQCKLEVATTKTNVTVTDGTSTWNVNGILMLPGSKKYTVSDGTTSKDVYADYGSYIRVEI